MDAIVPVVALTSLAGAMIPVGGLLASFERVLPRWLEQELRPAMIAFGGGILLSAVALVLVPTGIQGLPLLVVVASIGLGGVAFLLLDVILYRTGTAAAQLAAMLSDFLPEALALGTTFTTGESSGLLLALLIALQNLPEGFNAYRESVSSRGLNRTTTLWAFAALVPLGPLAGICGLFVFAPFPHIVHLIMLFSAGGILYLTFQDIAPQARLKKHWAPPLGAVAGFLLGLVGKIVIEGVPP